MERAEILLIFGGSSLQRSIILNASKMGIITVIIDPNFEASERNTSDFFEVVEANDFEKTCAVINKYQISGIITAATDKPLIMMAKIAKKYNFPFFSENTAIRTTDKWLMKKVFQKNNIPYANGIETDKIISVEKYPVIVKPKDNSGSRGVYYCQNNIELASYFEQSKLFSKHSNLIIEEFIRGKEYSIEAVHTKNETFLVQITEKNTTDFPYNVELAHFAPANLDPKIIDKITFLIKNISLAFDYKYCISHTEIKIDGDTIFVIETSPRLGGDFITSHLVPISTGYNIEDSLIKLSLGKEVESYELKHGLQTIVGIQYLDIQQNKVQKDIDIPEFVKKYDLIELSFSLKKGDIAPKITNSIDRYGYFISKASNKNEILKLKQAILDEII
jgi:biotin carboxylase